MLKALNRPFNYNLRLVVKDEHMPGKKLIPHAVNNCVFLPEILRKFRNGFAHFNCHCFKILATVYKIYKLQ